MRYLGIDYGTKRVGLALSDPSGIMAFPMEVVPNDGKLLKTILSIIEEEGVGAVVIGHSKDLKGEDNPVQADIESLMTDLTLERPIPVHLQLEYYSTKEALRLQGRNAETDASAAAIILNSYLTRTKEVE